jgi:peptidoglycan/xylan/chitin deacetylase (PgdA/CDA1 family)
VSDWLDPVREALDAADPPSRFFFRDDDAGWANDQLEALLDTFEPHNLPLDVAAIPAEVTHHTVRLLVERRDLGRNDVTVHQHGFAHVNHEPEGRKCEFGPSRTPQQQRDDVARGRVQLTELLGELPPVFTPPWNRCADWTPTVLRGLGFSVLSRDASAGRADVPGLVELPITVDWFAKRKKVPVDRDGRAALIAEGVRSGEPVGVMLHHEVMSPDDLADLDQLLALLGVHGRVSVEHLDRIALPAAT